MHVGHECSFVYDIADLYKAEVTIPVAFEMAAQQPDDLPSATRRRVRDAMVSAHILERMVRDIHILFPMMNGLQKKLLQKLFIYGMTKGTVPNGISYGFQGRGIYMIVITLSDCPPKVQGRLVQMAD